MSVQVKHPCVYIIASGANGVLYIGVTSNIHGRMAQHDQGLIGGCTKKHGVKLLVYYEYFETMPEATQREKRLKEWHGNPPVFDPQLRSCAHRSVLHGAMRTG